MNPALLFQSLQIALAQVQARAARRDARTARTARAGGADRASQQGQAMVEYSLVLALVCAASAAALAGLHDALANVFVQIHAALAG